MDWIVSIGPAKPGDAPAIVAFLERFGLPAAEVVENLRDFIVARDDGRLVGTVGFERSGPEAFLRSLAVDPDHRGRGLGRRLAREAIDRAARQGLERVFLLAQARPEFFLSLGFVAIDRGDFPAGFPGQEALARGACAAQALMRLDFA